MIAITIMMTHKSKYAFEQVIITINKDDNNNTNTDGPNRYSADSDNDSGFTSQQMLCVRGTSFALEGQQ